MSSDSDRLAKLEIAHVLFMDIVDYSRMPLQEQPRRLAELQDIIRGTAEFGRAEASGDLLRVPTGDGMALVFFRDPVAAVQCAMEVAGVVREREDLRLRMGLHSGPVYRVEDINANANVAGGGITIAKRVMDCGDAGHILLSNAVVELLGQVGPWPLHDLGDQAVKHGQRVHLFSLYGEGVGNAALPSQLRPASLGAAGRIGSASPAARSESTAGRDGGARKVAVLYKREGQPDEPLMAMLERHLKGQGYEVFIDRHLTVGVEWAKEIEQQIRTSDAVIPLLSAASIPSEMMAYEIEIAHMAAQERGRPRLLPVRVQYTGELTPAMAVYLDPLQHAVWTGPQDDEGLVAELVQALQQPFGVAMTAPRAKLEPVGGAMPLDSAFYVVRPEDEQFHTAIARRDSIVLLKGARQMGKTTLLARGVQQARQSGARVVLTDFQKLNAPDLVSAESLFLTLAEWIADCLDLDVMPEEVWHARRGPSVNFERYLRREVLAKIPEPIFWGMDEVDRIFTCDFGSEVFGLFRSWHNERALDPAGPWSRLTLAIAYATEAHLFITDMNQSPFNVGTRLTLEDFTFEQVEDLNARHGSPLRDGAEVARFYRLLSGHPYLVRRGLLEMATHGFGVAAFEAQADREDGIFGDHLRRILVLLSRDPELLDIVRGVLRGRPCPTPESFYRLRAPGVVSGDSARDVRPRCQLYATYLERHLL
jgi:class 3 adenylate cyclase